MIDPITLDSIRWYISYGEGSLDTIGLSEMFNAWWNKRKDNRAYSSLGRSHWRQVWNVACDQMRRELALCNGNGRCPTCGAKIKVRRCLACDLKDGAKI